MSGHTHTHTHTYTRQLLYPRCAHAHRGLITLRSMPRMVIERAPLRRVGWCISLVYIIGSNLSEPHLDELAGAFLWYIYIYIYTRSTYTHHASRQIYTGKIA